MLEAESIKCFRIVDPSDEGCRSLVFEAAQDLVPEVHQEVVDAAPLDAPILVVLSADLH